jgi:tRNA (guanine37-N1)-methyltransferase
MSFRVSVLTIFPEMFPGPLGHSLAGRALAAGRWSLQAVDLRDFALDRHGSVDDAPFGGGAGMVMRPDVVARALDSVTDGRPILYMSARGRPLSQTRVRELATGPGVILLCGRFEGVDQRVLEARQIEEVTVGDVVLSGGEPAAILLLDACVRLLPGVVGRPESLAEESFADGLLEYPQYTRPPTFEGRPVPPVLISGHHAKVHAWRRAEAEAATRARRPDLWQAHTTRTNPPPGNATPGPARTK